jgi:co-chaperonin GroES (HSP10)
MSKKIQINPVGNMVLIRHDEEQKTTSSGLILPDSAKVDVLTGMIAALPERMKEDRIEYPFEETNRVIYDIRYRIPIELMPGNRYFLVDCKYIYGVVEDVSDND